MLLLNVYMYMFVEIVVEFVFEMLGIDVLEMVMLMCGLCGVVGVSIGLIVMIFDGVCYEFCYLWEKVFVLYVVDVLFIVVMLELM